MTLAQWRNLKVGDLLIDRSHRDAKRRVLAISHVSGKKEQRGLTRTCLTLTNLKQPGGKTVIFESDNTGPARFDLASPAGAK